MSFDFREIDPNLDRAPDALVDAEARFPARNNYRVTLRRSETLNAPADRHIEELRAFTVDEAVYRAKRRMVGGIWFDVWMSDILVDKVEVLP